MRRKEEIEMIKVEKKIEIVLRDIEGDIGEDEELVEV